MYPFLSIIRTIKSRKMRLEGHVACMEEKNTNTVLVGMPKRKRSLGRSRYRCDKILN
jgi:hypothetical protein